MRSLVQGHTPAFAETLINQFIKYLKATCRQASFDEPCYALSSLHFPSREGIQFTSKRSSTKFPVEPHYLTAESAMSRRGEVQAGPASFLSLFILSPIRQKYSLCRNLPQIHRQILLTQHMCEIRRDLALSAIRRNQHQPGELI